MGKKPNTATALLMVSLLVWQGCASTKMHEDLSPACIRPDQLAFVALGHTTRPEFEAKLGKPWMHYPDLNVSVYCWQRVGKGAGDDSFLVPSQYNPADPRRIVMMAAGLALVPPMQIASSLGWDPGISGTQLLCVAFDANDRVVKWATMPHPCKGTTKEAASAWLSKAKSTSP